MNPLDYVWDVRRCPLDGGIVYVKGATAKGDLCLCGRYAFFPKLQRAHPELVDAQAETDTRQGSNAS
jgi:hypothetical protein